MELTDKEEIRAKADLIKASGGKLSVELTEKEFRTLFGMPRPTPERLTAMRAIAAERRAEQKKQRRTAEQILKRDHDETLDELVPLALFVLNECMHDANPNVRFRAAVEVLNRKLGKPTQQIKMMEEKAADIVYKSTVLDAMKEGEAGVRN